MWCDECKSQNVKTCRRATQIIKIEQKLQSSHHRMESIELDLLAAPGSDCLQVVVVDVCTVPSVRMHVSVSDSAPLRPLTPALWSWYNTGKAELILTHSDHHHVLVSGRPGPEILVYNKQQSEVIQIFLVNLSNHYGEYFWVSSVRVVFIL